MDELMADSLAEYTPKTLCHHVDKKPSLSKTPQHMELTFASSRISPLLDLFYRKDDQYRLDAFNSLAHLLCVENRGLYSLGCIEVLAGTAVDAFLNHDFINSRSMYLTYIFLKSIQDSPSIGSFDKVDLFFESGLAPINEETMKQNTGTPMTPWGAKCSILPGNTKLNQLTFMEFARNCYMKTACEELFLQELKKFVNCNCLDAEDPSSPHFRPYPIHPGEWEPCIELPSKKQWCYNTIDCFHCGKADFEKSNKRCGGCRLVTFCSKECQKKNWKTHKKVCGKQPEWWGRVKKASK